MAGLGRRTHYRKHVTDSVLNDFPEPVEDESIAVIVATRGSNQFDIRKPHSAEAQLAILPTKFRKLVWLKRNDYVIVTTAASNKPEDGDPTEATTVAGDERSLSTTVTASEETGSIRCMVTHILYSEQIKHLRAKGLWPTGDPGFDSAATEKENPSEQQQTKTDGIVYEQGYDDDSENENDDDLFVNTNRISRITIQDDSSDSE